MHVGLKQYIKDIDRSLIKIKISCKLDTIKKLSSDYLMRSDIPGW